MRNDIGLIFEAYRKVYEAANETGAVVSPNKSATASSTPPVGSAPEVTATTPAAPSSVKLSIDDVKKILKNTSDSFVKAKDTAEILQKNNVSGTMQTLQAEIQKLPSYILNIISLASPTTQQLNMLSKSLSLAPQIASMVNNVIKNLGPSGGNEQAASPTSTPKVPTTNMAPDKPLNNSNTGVVGGLSDTAQNSTINGAPVADDTVAPAAPATGDEVVAPAAPASGEEPVRRATLPSPKENSPYYIMTTKGPRMTTKGTPGAYQINKSETNK